MSSSSPNHSTYAFIARAAAARARFRSARYSTALVTFGVDPGRFPPRAAVSNASSSDRVVSNFRSSPSQCCASTFAAAISAATSSSVSSQSSSSAASPSPPHADPTAMMTRRCSSGRIPSAITPFISNATFIGPGAHDVAPSGRDRRSLRLPRRLKP